MRERNEGGENGEEVKEERRGVSPFLSGPDSRNRHKSRRFIICVGEGTPKIRSDGELAAQGGCEKKKKKKKKGRTGRCGGGGREEEEWMNERTAGVGRGGFKRPIAQPSD